MRRIKDEEERKRLIQRGQELSEQYEKNRQAVHQAEDDTIKKWQQQQQIEQQLNQMQTSRTPFRQNNPTPITPQVKNRNTWDNIISFFKNIGSGVENSFLSAGKYMENITENMNPNYRGGRQAQFLSSPNVSTMDKAKVKSVQNISDTNIIKSLNADNGKSVEEKVKEANEKTKEETKDIVLPETNLRKNVISTRQESVQNEMANETSKATGKVSRYLIGDIAPSIGQNVAQAGMSALNPALGMGFSFYSAGGSYYDDAIQRGMTNRQALLFSSVGASVEALTEQLSFQNATKAGKGIKSLITTGSLKNITKEASEDIVESTIKRAFKDYGISIAEEGIQEFVTTPIMEVVAQAEAGKGNFDNLLQRSLQDGLAGMISSAITGGANIGVQSCDAVLTKVSNGQQVSQEEIIKAYNDAVKNGVQAKSIDSSLQDVYNRNISRTEIISDTERTESNGYKENLQEMVNNLDIPEEVKAQIQPMLDSDATINAEEYKDITNNIKTLVKANTQQQIADYGAELSTQYNAIEEQRQNLDNIKPENFKDQESRRFYAQQMNKEFSDNTLDAILATYPENRNGNRTVKQYKEIAKEYGKQMALNGLSFDEVRENTVGAWQYYEPNKNITRYDNKEHKNQSFDRLNSQVWSQEVYNSYRDTMKAQLDQQQQELGKIATDRINEIEDEGNILIDTIDNLKPSVEKIKSSLVQSAEQYGYRGKKLAEIEKLMERRGINSYFDDTQFTDSSQGSFYNPKTNEIVFNPNASQDQIIQELAVHEWYHDLKAKGQGEEIQKSVIGFLENNKEYQELHKSLEKAYAKLTDPNTGEYLYDVDSKEFKDMIDEEATAKTLQRVLGNDTEIQRLINYKPSLARRIYDAVVDLLNKFTGGRIEKLYWEDVRNKFEKAFNETGINTRQGKIRFDINGDGKDFFYRGQENEGNNLSYNSTNFIGSEDEGFYFTPNKETASKYGKNLIEKYRNENNTVTVAESDKLQKMATDIINEHMKQGIWEDGDDILEQMALGRSKAFAEYTGKPFVETGDMFGEEAEAVYYPEFDKEENNTSTTDNQGRTLTKEQQEYFKNSKVRDSEGNLITLYHGTDSEVTTFDTNKPTYARYGSGAYLTDGIGIASEFADIRAESNNGKARIIEGYANIDKMFDNTTGLRENTPERQKLFELLKERGLSDRQLSNIESAEIDYPFQLMERYLVKDEVTKDPWIKADTVNELLREAGYNGIKGYYGDGSYEYIAFNSNQIKNVDNKAPTTNSDIRYQNETNFDDWANNNLPSLGEGKTTLGELRTEQPKLPVNQPKTTQPKLPTTKKTQTSQNNNVVNDILDYANLREQVINDKITEADFDKASNIEDIKKQLTDLGMTDKQIENTMHDIFDLSEDTLNKRNIQDIIDINKLTDFREQQKLRAEIQKRNFENLERLGIPLTTDEYDLSFTPEDLHNALVYSDTSPEATQPILPTTNVQPTTENLEIPNEQTSLPLGEQVNPSERKQRKTYKSIIESPVMSEEAKKVARKFIGQDTYTPDSNLKQLERADNIISRLGVEKALNQLESNAMEGRTIKAEDIATGNRLIEYYSKIGDGENLQRAVRATAMAGTQAGRSVQAFALLKHQTPQGMAIWIQNSVDKLNSQMKKGQFDFTPEMKQKIASSTEENLQQNVDEVIKELGQQVPQDLLGKLDSWRYFSMLANPKTHIRNIVGNFAMGLTQQFKSKVAGTIEQVTGQDRTHTSFLEKRNKANIDFAKNDLKNVSAQLGIGESKYSNPKTQIQQNQRTFKSDILENTLGRLFKLNDKLLEAEDNFGLKNAYVRNLSDYMTANKLNPNTITNEQLQKARSIAIEEALRATFHQESSLASMLNQLESKNSLTRTLVGGLVPFKKTPINVAKSGFEYSPAGLAKTIVYDSVQLRKGNINVNEYIDNISKGLTGTGIALVGYALAEAGILKAAGDDDKEDKYKEAMGEQPYSITINGKSYSLDWLAPTGIPLFVGAELNKLVHDTEEKDGETENEVLKAIGRVADATSSLLNPMSEMSMISGLTSTLQSYSQDPGQALMNLPINMLKSYTNQFVPTAVGQVARTMDKYERDTSSTEKGLLPKAIDQTKNQMMNKIPGLRQLLPTKKDIWGNEIETQDYFHNAVLPYTKKEVKTNAVDKELNDLYERTGESIYPNTSLSKTVTYEGSKTRLTNQDYNEFKTNYGKTSYKLLEDLTKSQEYKGMTDAQKVQAIKDVYTYSNNLNKTEYAEKKGIEFKTPTDVQQVRAVKAYGGKESDYFKYKGITDGLSKDSEKMVALRNSNLSAKSKRAVYSATLGKDDTFFQSTDINVNEYLGYKTANIQGVKDSNGKTISGSKKAAQLDYINNNISGYENRLLLMGKDYKLSRSQQQDLAAYIDTLDNAEELYTMFDKNFTVKSSSSLGQYGKGNIDLYNRPIVTNSDGSISTVRSMSFEENGKEILIPTVVNGRVVSDDEAIDHYHRTGEYLGKFNSVKEADDYAEKLHEDQEKMYSSGGRTTGYTVYYK